MYFSDIQIKNYKSYRDSATLTLEKGINVIVGKNNAGKTALLEALSLKFAAHPHRSIYTLPTEDSFLEPTSKVEFSITLTRGELLNLLADLASNRNDEQHVPLPSKNDPIWKELGLKEYDDETANLFSEWFLSLDTYTFRLMREAYGSGNEGNWFW